MSLREKLQTIRNEMPAEQLAPQKAAADGTAAYLDLKTRIHHKLLDRVDLAAMESLPADRLKQEIALFVERLLGEESMAINEVERRTLVRDIQHEMLGLGPARALDGGPHHLGHSGQRPQPGVRRAARQARVRRH